MIQVNDLSMGWDGVAIQEHLDFEIQRGEVFLILGGSGCGKSTLLRHMIGLQVPMSGSVEIQGIGDPRGVTGPPRFICSTKSGTIEPREAMTFP